MSRENSLYDFIYLEEGCPISMIRIGELEDPVVFNNRVYSKDSLTQWYLTRFNDGSLTFEDIITKKKLPPVKFQKTCLEILLSCAPKLSKAERKAVKLFIFMISVVASKPLALLNQSDVISSDTYIIALHVKSIFATLIGIMFLMDVVREILPYVQNNAERNEEAVKDWLADQIEVYDPDVHIPKEDFDQLNREETAVVGLQ